MALKLGATSPRRMAVGRATGKRWKMKENLHLPRSILGLTMGFPINRFPSKTELWANQRAPSPIVVRAGRRGYKLALPGQPKSIVLDAQVTQQWLVPRTLLASPPVVRLPARWSPPRLPASRHPLPLASRSPIAIAPAPLRSVRSVATRSRLSS